MINVYGVPLGSYLIHSIGIPTRMLLKHQISAEGKDLKPSLEKMQLSEEGPMPPTICHVGECSDSGLGYGRPRALSQLFVLPGECRRLQAMGYWRAVAVHFALRNWILN